MSNSDLISVIIPVKNGGKYLSQTLDGIKNQGMKVEIIVVDDGSTDSTAEIAKTYNCTIVSHETSVGAVAAINSGLKVAAGKYVMFHDADDIMRDKVLEKLYKELVSDKDYSAIEAKVQDFYSPDMTEEERTKILIKSEPDWGLFTGAILMKKDIFDKVGLFNENLKAGEIIEWQSKMDLNGLKVKKVDFVSTDRRIHASNFGRTNRSAEFKDYAAILRARLSSRK